MVYEHPADIDAIMGKQLELSIDIRRFPVTNCDQAALKIVVVKNIAAKPLFAPGVGGVQKGPPQLK
jgi:hypothetical protein